MKKRICCFAFLLLSLSTIAQTKNWMLAPFLKQDSVNPCLIPSPVTFFDPIRKTSVAWEEKDVFNPAAVVRKGKVYLLYRAQDKIGKPAGTSRIGLAYSSDGLHFTKMKTPVLYPANDAYKKYEWEGGCEDPRIVEDDKGIYYMTYTAYDGTTARLFIATSKDLIHWTKHGSAFKKADPKYITYWSKSGSIICTRQGEKMIATRINGKYWMYWGESNIYMATSDNLIDWTPTKETDPSKKQFDSLRNYEAFKILFSPRKGKFDSELVEPGPPAMITNNGIVFIYNSKNSPEYGDKNLRAGEYAAGQILLNKNNPTQVIDRCDKNFFHPDKPYEITGQVNNVCFLEGLVYFKGKWFLYYGTADSKIAVAVRYTRAIGPFKIHSRNSVVGEAKPRRVEHQQPCDFFVFTKPSDPLFVLVLNKTKQLPFCFQALLSWL